jgi:cell division protein ZapA
MNQEPDPITVRILDKDYVVACQPEEKPGLLGAARHLDDRMREIRRTGRVIGTDRIAVMAALNLAYELLQKGQTEGALDAATADRLATIQARIAAALADDERQTSSPGEHSATAPDGPRTTASVP